jgi:hypothetical protein
LGVQKWSLATGQVGPEFWKEEFNTLLVFGIARDDVDCLATERAAAAFAALERKRELVLLVLLSFCFCRACFDAGVAELLIALASRGDNFSSIVNHVRIFNSRLFSPENILLLGCKGGRFWICAIRCSR